jgi:hypothetical protein
LFLGNFSKSLNISTGSLSDASEAEEIKLHRKKPPADKESIECSIRTLNPQNICLVFSERVALRRISLSTPGVAVV